MDKQKVLYLFTIVNFVGLIFNYYLLSKKEDHKFIEELTVEKINVVEADGTRSLIIANAEKLPGSIIGKHRGESRESPGILFYNHKGNESGGLIFDSQKNDSVFYAYHHLSFDQFDDDQVLALTNNQGQGYHRKGLMINQLPYDQNLYDFFEAIDSIMTQDPTIERETARRRVIRENFKKGKGMIERLFLGAENGNSLLRFQDKNGTPRIKIALDDETGSAAIIFYDQDGKESNRIE